MARAATRAALPQGLRMSAAQLIDRLDRVRQTGPGRWIARCPAHDDRSPSLSIRDADDRTLIHCFGGCEPGDVLAAVGLHMSDLFDHPLGEFKPSRSRIPASDLLAIVDHEILVAVMILDDVLVTGRIDADQRARLTECADRIGKARDMAAPLRWRHA